MKTFRKLQSRAAKVAPVPYFRSVVTEIRRILGRPSSPVGAASFECDAFACAYLSYNLTRKAVDPALLSNTEREELAALAQSVGDHGFKTTASATAMARFTQRESINHTLNATELFGYDRASGTHESDNSVGLNVLLMARDIVHDILGREIPYRQVANAAAFGSGASANLKRREAASETKYLAPLTGTSKIQPLMRSMVSGCPLWASLHDGSDVVHIDQRGNHVISAECLSTCDEAVMDFVPKDASTDRIIMKEPEFNGYLQKGIGFAIRNKLRGYRLNGIEGIDLNRSGIINSELARWGSLDGNLATIDAKAASDSLTLALMEFLLPEAWFKLCLVARSPRVRLPDGTIHTLAMMGGMGNGFIFELESVVFYAIGVAAASRSVYPFAENAVSIHGDDLIVPSDVADVVSMAFERAGVVVNSEKSFSLGPFRESCGGHWFNGTCVKPFYIKDQTGRLQGDWFWLHNSLLLWLSERSSAFLASSKGKDLLQVLAACAMYASNGNPGQSRVGTERSRRSGLYGPTPPFVKGWFRARLLIERDMCLSCTLDEGRYIKWLNHPTRVWTPLELCQRRDEIEPTYVASRSDVVEFMGWRRLTSFVPHEHPLITPHLWGPKGLLTSPL